MRLEPHGMEELVLIGLPGRGSDSHEAVQGLETFRLDVEHLLGALPEASDMPIQELNHEDYGVGRGRERQTVVQRMRG